jgi:hypothetical protein
MDKICFHLDGEPDKLLAFKRQWLRLHPNVYKGPLVSNRRQGSSKPNKSNKKRLFSDDRPSADDIAEPDPDSEHVHDSNAIHELLRDIDINSDEDQVDT